MDKKKLEIGGHKKQNTFTNYTVIKYLTSPRTVKHNYQIPSSKMEVINLHKDSGRKKSKKMYNSILGSDNTSKKRLKKDPKSTLMTSIQNVISHPSKAPVAYQIKPKKLKKKPFVPLSAKGKGISSTIELSKSRKSSSRKANLLPKTHIKSKSSISANKTIRNSGE